jgi:hypothetical protein
MKERKWENKKKRKRQKRYLGQLLTISAHLSFTNCAAHLAHACARALPHCQVGPTLQHAPRALRCFLAVWLCALPCQLSVSLNKLPNSAGVCAVIVSPATPTSFPRLVRVVNKWPPRITPSSGRFREPRRGDRCTTAAANSTAAVAHDRRRLVPPSPPFGTHNRGPVVRKGARIVLGGQSGCSRTRLIVNSSP